MTEFVPEGKAVATGSCFVKILFFVDNTCQALLADQMGSSGTETRFDKHKKTKIVRNHQIYIKM